jgi:superfamily II DNA or RNA helicase
VTLEAAYLNARLPAEARVVFFSASAPTEVQDGVRAALPAEFQGVVEEVVEDVDFQILLPCEESDLQPITVARAREDLKSGVRVAPALWQIPGKALDLPTAVPMLAAMDPATQNPGLMMLIHASRLVLAMLQKGDFAPAQSTKLYRHVPHFSQQSLRILSALAEIAPESLLTARFAAGEDPVYNETPHNLVLSFVGHALDACCNGYSPQHEVAERPPQSFWKTTIEPVLEILVPDNELEEGVPWAIQLLFRPVPGLELNFSLDMLRARVGDGLFVEGFTKDALSRLEFMLENLAKKVPVFRRAMNMMEGKASLNRQELDTVLDHIPFLESRGFQVTLPGYEGFERLAARVTLTEEDDGSGGPRPWFVFNWTLAIGKKELDEEDLATLLNSTSPLVQLKGGPVLLTPSDRQAIEEFKKSVGESGNRISFFEALRLRLGGATHLHGLALESLETSERLDRLVHCLEQARIIEDRELPKGFVGDLRPYQIRGHAWLYFLVDQGFGACLADDMGLGKTIQAIVLILDWLKRNRDLHNTSLPILIVCPVSVLGNWRRECNRFAPELDVVLHHGKFRARDEESFRRDIADHDVVLTSYSLLQRDEEMFSKCSYGGVILDEAQNIKNPNTRQSKSARKLVGGFRIALTGTPLENRPLDLWSIMDFLNEGLLGNKSHFLKTLEHPIIRQQSKTQANTLAKLVRPFVLRRLKTDPDIIDDLPEKTEQVVLTGLSKEQATLYEKIANDGLEQVESSVEGIARRGAILTTLLRLKQVCNHPAHYANDGSSLANRSNKLDLLTEMLEEAIAEGDRCLVFSQFKEMGTLLKTHVENTFNQKALFLHGGVPQKDREEMVETFQKSEEDGPKIFVLSLKAGGTGLNLTAANRVFHYDRWWNPAVEDQATDRAFRIGQQRNVFVHKFVCTGTLEERIQEMLERKREVAENLLSAGEGWITELSNEELRQLLTLDRSEALA